MTQCTQFSFEFEAHRSRRVVAGFDGGAMTSDAGALLLRSTEQRLGLVSRLGRCFTDFRNQERVEHSVTEMVAQRVYALALGYADLNDHDQLRDDPLMGLLAGKRGSHLNRAGRELGQRCRRQQHESIPRRRCGKNIPPRIDVARA